MSGNGRTGNTTFAELLALRWQEDRPYFTPSDRARRTGLRSFWLRSSGQPALEMHWARLPPAHA